MNVVVPRINIKDTYRVCDISIPYFHSAAHVRALSVTLPSPSLSIFALPCPEMPSCFSISSTVSPQSDTCQNHKSSSVLNIDFCEVAFLKRNEFPEPLQVFLNLKYYVKQETEKQICSYHTISFSFRYSKHINIYDLELP